MARGIGIRLFVYAFAVFLPLLMGGCGEPSGPVLIASYPLDNRDGLLADQESVDIDTEVSTDGGGSIHVYTENRMLVNLYELPTESIAGNAVVARCVCQLDLHLALFDLRCEFLDEFVDDAPHDVGRER